MHPLLLVPLPSRAKKRAHALLLQQCHTWYISRYPGPRVSSETRVAHHDSPHNQFWSAAPFFKPCLVKTNVARSNNTKKSGTVIVRIFSRQARDFVFCFQAIFVFCLLGYVCLFCEKICHLVYVSECLVVFWGFFIFPTSSYGRGTWAAPRPPAFLGPDEHFCSLETGTVMVPP